jgi:ABC-type polysaccharide/polyol phosphate transport system ATPase subunit
LTAEITVHDASLRFRIYRNPTPGLKESAIRLFSRNRRDDNVLEFDALKNVSFSLSGGDRLGIIGLNGAGKSTLLKMIVGIYPPQTGTVYVSGKITPMIELGTGFDLELSGRENIYLNGSLIGRSFKQMRALEAAIIDFSELNEMIDMPVKYYSSGMYGRLAFSIGAIVDPEILLLDEIFAAGDAHFVQKASARLHELFSNSQIVVLVSHELEQIRSICTKVMVMHKGRIVNQGSPDEMIDYYLEEIVAAEFAHAG